jgi:hypothetical protein
LQAVNDALDGLKKGNDDLVAQKLVDLADEIRNEEDLAGLVSSEAYIAALQLPTPLPRTLSFPLPSTLSFPKLEG